MRTPDLGKVIERLRENAADGDRLERYVRERDELAFAGIVRRHGPMVWAVCNRVLHHVQDCEDAFQAVFLLLVRKAGAIGRPERLASWLHGVAYRTALEARKARRKRAEKEAAAVLRTESPGESGAELREVLDKELARLPQKYRAVLVLCYLEGRTRSEVARQLNLAEGTVASRLSRGRAILARRLTRYGLPSGAVATFLAEESSAAVPKALFDATMKAAGLLAAGGAVSGQAVLLMQGVLNAMFVTKLKVAAAVLLVVMLLGTGLVAGVLAYGSQTTEQERGEPKPDPAKLQAAEQKADPQTPKTVDIFDLLREQNAARFDEQFLDKRLRMSVKPESVMRMEDPKAGSYYLVTAQALRPLPGDPFGGGQAGGPFGGRQERFSSAGWVSFKFDLGSRKQLAELEMGKPVTIEGRCLGKTLEAIPRWGLKQDELLVRLIKFDDCKLIAADK